MALQPPNRKVSGAVALVTALTVSFEGLRQKAYYDPPGILTVCYGTTGKDVIKDKIYTLNECKAFLSRDMLKAVEEVDRCVPDAPQYVLAAFGDVSYNLGSKIACDITQSTAARKLKLKDWYGACQELLKWDKAKVAGVLVALPGLTKRRIADRDLCVKDLV